MSDDKQPEAEAEPQQTVKDEPVKNDEKLATSGSASDKPKTNSLFNSVISLLSLIAFVAVVVVGYIGFQQIQKISDRLLTLEQQGRNYQSDVEQTKNSLRTDFEQMQNQLQKQLQDSTLQQADLNDKKIQTISQQLSATRRQIQSVSGRHQSDWLLAEADYLVRIATNRLLLERDHVTALALLLSAEERILLMDDPGLQPAREALARDMAALRLLKREDTAGIAIRISGLIPQLKTLPVLAFQLPEETIDQVEETVSPADANWFDNLKKSAGELSVKWFEIRDHGRPVTPLMAPEIEALLINNMNLLLQTAQFATLRQHQDLYHHSLLQLKQRVTEYFDITDQAVIAFLNEIDSLDALSIQIALPDTLESRIIIARLVEQRLQQSTLMPDTDQVSDTNQGEQ